jgi:hypothetical protein
MSEGRYTALEYNPHIRGMKATQSCSKLSDRGKAVYDLLVSQIKKDPKPDPRPIDLYNPKVQHTKFVAVSPSPPPLKPRHISNIRSIQSISKSPSKETLPFRKRELSPEEHAEVDNLIQTRLSTEYNELKKTVNRQIKKLSIHQVLPDELHALRADSLLAVKSKILYVISSERKMLPKLKREATSEVLLKRQQRVPLDITLRRKNVLAKIESLLVNKQQFMPNPVIEDKNEVDIVKALENAHQTLKVYSVKPFKTS